MKVYADEFKKIYDTSNHGGKTWYINDHTVIKSEDGWHLFGITRVEPASPLKEVLCAHAFSPDLLNFPFERLDPAMEAEKDKGELHFWAPHVIRNGNKYYMYYCAGSLEGHDKYRIHLATSDDLLNWTKHPDNPLIVDGYDARDPMIISVDGHWLMYYTCNSTPTGGYHCIACMRSADLIRWTDKKIVFTSDITGTYGGPCESPFVLKRKEKYYLFIGPYGGYDVSYSDTAVYVSDDPLSFDGSKLVGRIPAHASEIIEFNGEYYITHCGWGKGGVYLAHLNFEE